jgi:hypothetical protein
MKTLIAFIFALSVTACNNQKPKSVVNQKVLENKGPNVFRNVDTSAVTTMDNYLAQYQKFLEASQLNKDLIASDMNLLADEIKLSTFFISKETEFMDFENPKYMKFREKLDSLDGVYEQK